MNKQTSAEVCVARVWALIAAATLLGLALLFVFHGLLNADEGFYLMASLLVRQGFRPYLDFGFSQTPLLPYLNVLWLEVFGYSLAGIRLASLLWTAICVASGMVWLKQRHSWAAAGVFALLLLASPGWLAFAVKGKTYAFAGLAVLVASMAILSDGRLWIRWAIFVGASALAVGARLPMAGFCLPAGVCFLVLSPGWKGRIIAISTTATCSVVVLVFAAAGAWENFLFWTVEFHGQTTLHHSVFKRGFDSLRYAPGVWLVSAVAFALFLRQHARPQLMVLASLLLGVLSNVSMSTSYAEYIFPFIPALAFVTAPAMADLVARWTRRTWCVGIVIILAAGWNFPPKYTRNLLLIAHQAESFLRSNVAPGSVVACSMPEIPAATNHRVPLSMAMGKFSLTEDFDSEVAARRLMLTPTTLQQHLEDPATKALVVSKGRNWSFLWSVPSYCILSQAGQERLRITVFTGYRLAFMNEEYAIFLRKSESAHSSAQ